MNILYGPDIVKYVYFGQTQTSYNMLKSYVLQQVNEWQLLLLAEIITCLYNVFCVYHYAI